MIAVRIQRPDDCRDAPPLLELINPRWLKANQVEPIAEAQSNEAASSTCFAAMTAALQLYAKLSAARVRWISRILMCDHLTAVS